MKKTPPPRTPDPQIQALRIRPPLHSNPRNQLPLFGVNLFFHHRNHVTPRKHPPLDFQVSWGGGYI